MSEYHLCARCKRVPVAEPGDRCEACEREAAKQDARNVEAIKRQGKKPHNWRDVWGTWRRR